MFRHPSAGWIEVICGPMFSGKSEELIRRVTRSRIARLPVQAFKPALDVRFAESRVVSHSNMTFAATPVSGSDELLRAVEDATVVVGIDEGQFFDEGLVAVAEGWPRRASRWSLPDSTPITFADLSSPSRPCVDEPSSSPRRWRCVIDAVDPAFSRSESFARTISLCSVPRALTRPDAALCYDPEEAEQPALVLTEAD